MRHKNGTHFLINKNNHIMVSINIKTILLILTTSLTNFYALGQELEIIPIEHASAVLLEGQKTIFIDPVGEEVLYGNFNKPDLILITDIHWDHFNPKTLGAIMGAQTLILAPRAVVEKMIPSMQSQTTIINNGDVLEVLGIKIEALPMYNLRKEALDFHTKGRGNGYVLSIGDKRVYFSGDTEDIPEMRALKNIDMAFVTMNLPYTMTVTSAASAVLEFTPKSVYPYHYRGKPDVSDVGLFKSMVEKENPSIKVIQLDWYPRDSF
jgi:L-ascorbate metabolism protein UlaG (beta-lactamase superfamily)